MECCRVQTFVGWVMAFRRLVWWKQVTNVAAEGFTVGSREREGRARGGVWQPGCDEHHSRFKHARENGSNVLKQQRFSVRFSRL